jgi:hypothetical protein
MQLLELNVDVLDAIFSRLHANCLANLIATCRMAYDTALPHLISSVHLRHGAYQVLLFCDFMLSEKHRSRLVPMLRSLRVSGTIYPGTLQDSDTALLPLALTNLLEQAHSLRVLQIWQVGTFLDHEPRLFDAIINLPNLISIYFTGANDLTLNMISRMRDLCHVHISHDSDLTPIIRPFQSTLETVSSEYRHFKNNEDLISLKDTDQWRHVHTLNLGFLFLEPRRLVYSFPNLRRLRIQLALPPSNSPEPHACWPSLDYVETSITGFHRLALSCPVREMRFTSRPPAILAARGSTDTNSLFSTFLSLVRNSAPLALFFPTPPEYHDKSLFGRLSTALPNLRILGLSCLYEPDTPKRIVGISAAVMPFFGIDSLR